MLVAAVSLFLAWWIVRTTAVNDFARSRPMVVAQVAPGDPRVVAGLVDLDLRLNMGMARQRVKRMARQALVRAPLMDEPFLLGGIDRLLRRDTRGAAEMLEHALARNPRSRLARLFMLEVRLRSGDVKGAAADMTILGRLMPDVQRVFVPELARFARDPDTQGALRQVLDTDRHMLAQVLQHLAANDANPAVVLRLAGPNPPIATDADAADWRRTLLSSMVSKGNVRGARQLWARFAGVEEEEAQAAVYDGSFEGLPGLPPFNWNFSSSEIGAAERDRTGALQVEYYGRASGELASQLITLSPGRHRMMFHAEGDLDTPQHRLVWKVQCRRNERTIMEFPIANVTYAGRTLAGDFTVPADCQSQWLRLLGQPTEFPKIESVLIRNVRIERIGGAA